MFNKCLTLILQIIDYLYTKVYLQYRLIVARKRAMNKETLSIINKLIKPHVHKTAILTS